MPARDQLRNDLIGLALSGGGIRSAVFNLGFLQALSQRGFLRYVDYLCSVSGGGYIAGHLSALASSVSDGKNFHTVTAQELDHATTSCGATERIADLGVDARGRLTPSYRFRHIGSYLFSDIAGFIWRYLLFTLLTVLLVVSLVGMLASLAALVWRSLDTEPARDIIRLFGIGDLGLQLGLGDETLYAFLPSVVPFFFLIVSACLRALCHLGRFRLGRSWCSNSCRFWLRCWSVSLVISLAVLLGNGEMSFSLEQSLTQWQKNWTVPLLLMVVLSLLPFLRFSSVVNSARPDAPAWKGVVAVMLTTFTCAAGPFFMVFWMARENVSGYALYRDANLKRNDVEDWPAFIQLCHNIGDETAANHAGEAQDIVKAIDRGLYSKNILGGHSWDTHERLPHQSIWGAIARCQWLARYLLPFPTEVNGKTDIELSPNPIAAYRTLLAKQRDHQRDAVLAFNNDALRRPELTLRLVNIACGVNKEHHANTEESVDSNSLENRNSVELAWRPVADGTPAKVCAELAKRSREPENLKSFWQRSLLDALIIPSVKTDVPSSNSERTAAIARFLAPQLNTWLEDDIARFNRLLMEALFPHVIRPRVMISTTIVPERDQECRLQWLLAWTILSAILLFIDWNVISPFYVFYRNKLSRSFVRSAGLAPSSSTIEEPDLRMGDLRPWRRGAPYPLMLASMHFFRSVSSLSSVRPDTDPPDADRCQPFLLSPLHCGSAVTGWAQTNAYCQGELKLADAVALSGAAVTPFMVDNLGITALMAMTNLRIGQWLPVPAACRTGEPSPMYAEPQSAASGYRIGRELWSGLTSSASPDEYLKTCRMALVADGGFHDFFGLEELLLRRCRLIVVADAGCNNGRFEFGALADVLRLLRIMHGLEFLDLDHERPVDVNMLKRNPETSGQPLHHCCFRVRYPADFPVQDGPDETLIVYAQMSLTGDEDLDLQQFRNVNPTFPDEPTTNQRYSADQVESYRQLGFHIGGAVCQAVPESADGQISSDQWSAWFCEGYVRDWRRLKRSPLPLAGMHMDGMPFRQSSAWTEADHAITDFLRSPELRYRWRGHVKEWLRSKGRPEAMNAVPRIGDIVQLVMACQACTRLGGDFGSEAVFLPGGRVRLGDASIRVWNTFQSTEPAAAPLGNGQPPRLERTRKNVLRLLRNVAFAPGEPGKEVVGADKKEPTVVDKQTEVGCRMAALLLEWWDRGELPQFEFISREDLIVTEFEIFERTSDDGESLVHRRPSVRQRSSVTAATHAEKPPET